ncbi:MAG: HNH endonuclease [Oscillospiraceae bacterium]|nr:HNH endonuclease [Oscillospiraceae bacterium]
MNKILKSCKYCGRIHSEDYICPNKPTSKPTEQFILRSTYRWGKTREQIRKRDCFLCQICLREGIYNCEGIEVHHAIKIDENKRLAFEPSNLITLCREHHRQADEGEIPFEAIKRIIDEQEAKSTRCEATNLSLCAV